MRGTWSMVVPTGQPPALPEREKEWYMPDFWQAMSAFYGDRPEWMTVVPYAVLRTKSCVTVMWRDWTELPPLRSELLSLRKKGWTIELEPPALPK